jgi:choline dehydrogenase
MNDGMQRLFEIAQQPPFAEMADSIFSTVDGQPLTELPTGHDLDQWLLAQVWDAQHPVGTCRMGAPDDSRTVVDPSCAVLGLKNLRVIDASVMPENPRANTHFTTVMIAEKMTDELLRTL